MANKIKTVVTSLTVVKFHLSRRSSQKQKIYNSRIQLAFSFIVAIDHFPKPPVALISLKIIIIIVIN